MCQGTFFCVPKEGISCEGKALWQDPDRHIAVQRTFLQIERRLKMSSLWQTVSENVVFVLEFLALIVVMFLIAYVIEKQSRKK